MKLTRIPILISLSACELESGNLEQCEKLLSNISAELSKSANPLLRLRVTELFAKLQGLKGNLGEAKQCLVQVMVGSAQMKCDLSAATSALNLAQLMISLNQLSSAKDVLAVVTAFNQTLPAQPFTARISMLDSMVLYSIDSSVPMMSTSVSAMNATKGQSVSEKRIPVLSGSTVQHTSYLQYFEDNALSVMARLAAGDLDIAINLFKDLASIFNKTDSQLIRAKLVMLGAILEYYKATAKAIPDREALRLLIRHFDDVSKAFKRLQCQGMELWQAYRFAKWCRNRLGESDLQEKILVEQSLEQLVFSLPPKERSIYLLNKWTADEEILAEEVEGILSLSLSIPNCGLLKRIHSRFKVAREINGLLNRVDQHKDALAKSALSSDARFRQKHVSLLTRLIAVKPNEICVAYLVLPDRVVAIRIRNWSLDLFQFNISRVALRELVRSWHECITRATVPRNAEIEQGIAFLRSISISPDEEDNDISQSATARAAEVAKSLAEILGLNEMLGGNGQKEFKAVTFVPDDALHGVSFAALPFGNGTLVESFRVIAAFESAHSPVKQKNCALHPVLIGVDKKIASYDALPWVRTELDKVQEILQQTGNLPDILLNEDATKNAIANALTKSQLVHFACHGTFSLDEPDKSGLILLGTNDEPCLYALRELSNLSLCGGTHITLSACWSADHFTLPGRWIIGLPETLWRCGADSILGSLWPVADKFSVAFMQTFYKYLEKHSRVESLRYAQLEAIKKGWPVSLWAGFVLYGNAASLKLRHCRCTQCLEKKSKHRPT